MNEEERKREFEYDWVRMSNGDFFRKYYHGGWGGV